MSRGAPWALVGVLALHAGLGWRAVQAEGHIAASLCCDSTAGTLEQIRWLSAQVPLPGTMPWQPSHGLLALLGAAAWQLTQRLGGDPRFGLLALLVGGLLTQLLLFEIARRLRGPWTGVLAAALLPMLPIIAHAERRWDVAGAELPLLALGALLVLSSRGLTRLLPTLGWAGLTVAAGIFSPRETDNLLLLLALGSLALGALGRTLLTGRDAAGEPVSRAWGALLASGAAGATLWGLSRLVQFSSPAGESYYIDELHHFAQAPSGAVLAYVSHLYWRGLTPSLAVPTVLALLAFAWRGRGRAELLTWIALPTLLLSALPKRNFYYLSVIYPALPLVLALGVGALPRRWLRIVAATTVLTLASAQLLARYAPARVAGTPLARVRWLHGDHRFGGWFQTSDHDLRLAPRPNPTDDLFAAEITTRLPVNACLCPIEVNTRGDETPGELGFRLATSRPCLRVQSGPDVSSAGFAILHADTPMLTGFSRVSIGTEGDRVLAARPDAWFHSRCAR